MGCLKLTYEPVLKVITRTEQNTLSREGKSDAGLYKYKYNGKEYQDELGLNLYTYGFRLYDPAIGRFPSMDPISEKFPHVSTYNYAENEPVGSIDLWGLQRWIVAGRERNVAASEAQQNSATISFGFSHPIAAVRIGTVERGSTNISSVAGRFARHMAENNNMSVDIGSQRNAFRHVLWSSTINNTFSKRTALRATNAHEGVEVHQSSKIDFSKPFDSKDSMLADNIVDTLNNAIGASLAENNPDASAKELAQLALGEFKNNGFWTFSSDKDGNITISKTKISQKQYDTAMKTLNTLDENGFTKKELQQLENE